MADSAACPASSSSVCCMSPATKKRYACDPSLTIPISVLAAECHINKAKCSEHTSTQRNCKHNLHCLHGLGVLRKGIWDGHQPSASEPLRRSPSRLVWLTLLGSNPHDHARPVGSRVGLHNLGATCYLNTLFQFLFMDPTFRRAVYQFEAPLTEPSKSILAHIPSNDPQGKELKPTETYMHHIQQVFTHLDHSRQMSYNPSHIVNVLKLSQVDQQDVHEFLNLLVFQLIEKELQQSSNPICRLIIPRLFTGQIVHVMEGQGCGHTSERLSEFHDLSSIQIKGKKKLEECLDDYFQPEYMIADKEEHRWKCGTCGQRENAIRHTYLRDPPPILILQLGRFEFDFQSLTKKKLADAIKLPKRLDLSKYIQPTKPSEHADAAPSNMPNATAESSAPAPAPTPAAAAAGSTPQPPTHAPTSAHMHVDPPAPKKRSHRSKHDLPPSLESQVVHAMDVVQQATQKRSPANKRKRGTTADATAAHVTSGPPPPPISSLSSLSVKPIMPPDECKSTGQPRQRYNKRGKGAVTTMTYHDGDEDENRTRIDIRLDCAAAGAPSRIDLTAPDDGGRSPIHGPPSAEIELIQQMASPLIASSIRPPPTEIDTIDDHPIDPNQRTLDAYYSPVASPHKAPRSHTHAAPTHTPAPLPAPSADPVVAPSSPAAAAAVAAPTCSQSDFNQLPADEQKRLYPHHDDLRCRSDDCPHHPPWQVFDHTHWADRSELDHLLAQRMQQEETPKARRQRRPPARRTDTLTPTPAGQPAPSTAIDAANDEEPKPKKRKTGPKPKAARPTKAASVAPAAASPDGAIDVKDDAAGDVDLVTDSSIDPTGPNVYELVAILSHKGTSANHGHYTAEIMDQSTGQWFTFDDTKVTHKAPKKKQNATEDPVTAAAATPATSPASESIIDITGVDTDVIMIDSNPSTTHAASSATPTTTGTVDIDDTDDVQIVDDAPPDVDPTAAPITTPTTSRVRKRTAKVADAPEPAPSKRPRRAKTDVIYDDGEASVIDIDEAEQPQPSSASKSKRKKKKNLSELDDEENGDEEDYDPKSRPAKKGAAKAKKATAAAPKRPKANAKADVSVGAASTAYILIYRRCNTMHADWNPFTVADLQHELDQANAGLAAGGPPNVPLGSAAASPSAAAACASFTTSQPPPILLQPVMEANIILEKEIEDYANRRERLTAHVHERQAEVQLFLDAPPPSDFTAVQTALDMISSTSTPKSESAKVSPRVSPRERARRVKKDTTDAAAPAETATADLNTIQLGHYVSLPWLTAYLTGWVIDKDERDEGAAAADDGPDTKDAVKDDSKDAGDENEPIEIDADEPQQADTAPLPTRNNMEEKPDADTNEEKSNDEKHTPAPAQAASAPVLTPLQLFLKEHPHNDQLPWPGDLIESVETLKCEHGKLNPRRLQSAKRIGCAAWKILVDANQRWRESQTPTAMKEDTPVKKEEEDEPMAIKVESQSNSPATAVASSSSPLTLTIPMSTSTCVMPSCHLPGLTDADLCQQCAREALLGETLLTDAWEKHMLVYNEYVSWDIAQRDRENKEAGGGMIDMDGFVVSTIWWKNWKRELDAAAKALGRNTIVQRKKPLKAQAPGAAAAQSQKPLPKITTDCSITAAIRCPHDQLHPNVNHLLVPTSVWLHLKELFPHSDATPITGFDEEGKVNTCNQCKSEFDARSDQIKSNKAVLKQDKGRLKFIKTQQQFTHFPVFHKAPNDGLHHLMPVEFAWQLWEYFHPDTAVAKPVKPTPMSTQTLICNHGRLKYAPFPEDDQPDITTANITNAIATTTPADSGSPSAPICLSASAVKLTTPTGVLTICDDADYHHLKSRGLIDPNCVDVTLMVSKNLHNVTGDNSTWNRVHVDVNPPMCEACIAERIDSEQNTALDYDDESITIRHLKSDEKVDDEVMALSDPRRPVRAARRPKRDRKPVNIKVSSTTTIYDMKLKIFQADDTPINHQEILWVKPDGVLTLGDGSRTLRSYGVPANAELFIKLNSFATHDEYDQIASKGRVEHGFKGTALSGAHTISPKVTPVVAPNINIPPVTTGETDRTSAPPAAAAAAAAAPLTPAMSPDSDPAPLLPDILIAASSSDATSAPSTPAVVDPIPTPLDDPISPTFTASSPLTQPEPEPEPEPESTNQPMEIESEHNHQSHSEPQLTPLDLNLDSKPSSQSAAHATIDSHTVASESDIVANASNSDIPILPKMTDATTNAAIELSDDDTSDGEHKDAAAASALHLALPASNPDSEPNTNSIVASDPIDVESSLDPDEIHLPLAEEQPKKRKAAPVRHSTTRTTRPKSRRSR